MSAIKVVDRKGSTLCEFKENLSGDKTVLDFMKTIIRESSTLSKYFITNPLSLLAKKKFDVNRMRLTLGDAKGKAMSDKKTSIGKFFTPEDIKGGDPVVLVFKDLGLQISWKLVFLIEYFGPMLISSFFVVF
jgi:very-long-chain enoyl-CoA reductase